MKKYMVLLLLICICNLHGCKSGTMQEYERGVTEKNETGQTSEVTKNNGIAIEINIPVADESLNLMQKVVFGKVDLADGTNIFEKEGIYEGDYENNGFIVVDLDRDGIDEICIDYAPGEFLILHQDTDGVYSFIINYNAFWPVYTDGTFEGSGATASKSLLCGDVSFENNIFESHVIVEYENRGTARYYKSDEHVEISKEEYDNIMSNYSKKEATRYDFTIENILKYIP